MKSALFALFFVVWLAKLLRKFVFVPRLTMLSDLPKVGLQRNDAKIKGRAVVCGGSISGLLAAAVLSNHFDRVVVVEAEGSPEELGMSKPKPKTCRIMANGLSTPVPLRKRILQYLAIHDYGPLILLGLRKLFPELKQEFDYFGFSPVPLAYYFNYGNILSQEVYDPKDPATPKTLAITREALESLLRRLVVKHKPNVTFVTGTVIGFLGQTKGDTKLDAVRIRRADGESLEPAALIIDATGPSQLSYHKWLKNAGFGPFPASLLEEYDPFLSYVHSVWTLPEPIMSKIAKIVPYGGLTGSKYLNNPDFTTKDPRGLYISLFEGSQLMIVAGGWGITCEQMPHTIEEIRAYTKSLHNASMTPTWVFEIFNILEAHHDECAPWYLAVPAGKMSFIKYHESQQGTIPRNWIAIGDSAMKLNPIYAQGCLKALTEVVTLDSLLRYVSSCESELPSDFSYQYFKKAIARTEGMWYGNKASDYGWQTTQPAKGEDRRAGTFLRRFSQYFMYAGRSSRYAQAMFYELSMGLAPSTDVFAPALLVRVAWQWLTN